MTSPREFLRSARIGKDKDKSKSDKGTFVVEKRKHPRIRLELPLAYCIGDQGENCGGIVADASEEGLLVYLKEHIEVGTRLKIEIIFVKRTALSSVKGMAEVVWSDLTARESYGELRSRYGLQFQSVHEGEIEKLRDLLREIGQTYRQ